jgi:exopolyphosphatase/guanosine-5'-triphosphate,3'-diphosphate pyrophosphatase
MLTVDKTNNHNSYAVIDLGSNSFHMLIAKAVAGDLQVIGRIKRKVRLAAGLDENNQLSIEAMQRGWECLCLFAERLQDIPDKNITIVATATLRLAVNAQQFIEKAELLLGHKLRVISGEEEAKTIYKGVAHTSANSGKQLVIDIGGASTEVVIGNGFNPLLYKSLNIGCVTYFEKYFRDGLLTHTNFEAAIKAAKLVISDVADEYKTLGWLTVSGASGTVQAIQEIMVAQRQDDLLTLEKLNAIKDQAQLYQSIDTLKLPGLAQERKLVFASGLSILIALFECLDIEAMELAGGALREGVLYSMIPELHNSDIRERTINSFINRYHIDSTQSKRVADIANTLACQIKDKWLLNNEDLSLLDGAAKLHETGLLIGYKKYGLHGAYIMANTEMPGFTKAQKNQLVYLVKHHKDDIGNFKLEQLDGTSDKTRKLLHILRLAVILSMRRQDDVLPTLKLLVSDNDLSIVIPHVWYSQHPLMQAELEAESDCITKVGQTLHIAVN